jgi:hypothetical protein
MKLTKLPPLLSGPVAAILLSFILHFDHFDKELVGVHVWRQTQTQGTVDLFFGEDFCILNPRKYNRGAGDGIFRMEFPLMQWLIAGLLKLFGQHLIITRLFMFGMAAAAITGLYFWINELTRRKSTAFAGAWGLAFAPSFFYFSVNPLPDMMALATGIWGLFFFTRFQQSNKTLHVLLCGFLLTTATAVKLPYILFYAFPVSALLFTGHLSEKLKKMALLLFFLPLPGAWYISAIPNWHQTGVATGILNADERWSRLGYYLFHNAVSTLPELLLNYAAVPLFAGGLFFFFRKRKFNRPDARYYLLFGSAVTAYFLYELNMIGVDHDYYLFPFLPLLFLTVAYGFQQLRKSDYMSLRLLAYLALAVIPFTCWLRTHHRWDERKPGFNADLLTYRAELKNAVPENALCIAGNDQSGFIFFHYIHKKGWNFTGDDLQPHVLDSLRMNGAGYLYSDSRKMDENPEIRSQFENKVGEYGSIHVYRLKKYGNQLRLINAM